MKTANSNPNVETAMELQASLRTAAPSFEALQADYKKQQQTVRESAVYRLHMKQLETQLTEHPNVEASHALCLGLGSIANHYGRASNSMKQLIFFEDVIAHLKSRHRIAEPTHVYLQDPSFNALDTQFLTSLGHDVIPFPFGGAKWSMYKYSEDGRSPCAFTELYQAGRIPRQLTLNKIGALESTQYITENMFLYAPHLEFETIGMALAIAVPSLYLGTNLFDFDDSDLDQQALFSAEQLEADGNKLKTAIESLDWQAPMDEDPFYGQWHGDMSFAFAKVPEDCTISSEDRDQPSKETPTWKANGRERIKRRDDKRDEDRARDIRTADSLQDPMRFSNLAEMEDAFAEEKQKLSSMDPCDRLIACLDAAIVAKPDLHITEVICLGIGNFTTRNVEMAPHHYRPYRAPYEQLLLLEKAVEHLRTAGNMDAKAPVYLQDPCLDIGDTTKFLQGRGFEVIPIPPTPEFFTLEEFNAYWGMGRKVEIISGGPPMRVQCKQYLTGNTFLYCPNIGSLIPDEAIKHQPPALYIGNPEAAGGMQRPWKPKRQLSAATIEFGRKAAWYAINPKAFHTDSQDLDATSLKPGPLVNICNKFVLAIRDGRPSGREAGDSIVFENEGEGKLGEDDEGELVKGLSAANVSETSPQASK